MRTIALYGTESGRAEAIADAIARAFPERDIDVVNMADADTGVFRPGVLFLIVCATHGGGELPGFAQFLHDDLAELTPDLTGVTYAMFGLGDTIYTGKYNRGSEQFDRLLTGLGATRVGPFGAHDESTHEDHVHAGTQWARAVFDAIVP